MKWSVALFGHVKPEYSMIETEHDCLVATFQAAPGYDADAKAWVDGKILFPSKVYRLVEWDNTRRAQPGDVVAFKPVGSTWTETERKEFLIIEIDGPDRAQMEALCECEWDLDSYETYAPLAENDWYAAMMLKNLSMFDPQKATEILDLNRDKLYAEYITGLQFDRKYPTIHWRKRRFTLTSETLDGMGVDIPKMIDRDLVYVPKLTPVTDFSLIHDRLKKAQMTGTEGLHIIEPRTLDEMINPKDADQILTEIRS